MVNLLISGDSIVFEFINSNYYLQNGKIATPINSLALITDESNIATFKKASSNDIFVAATYDELGKTKAELIEWFKDNAVGETGGGGGLTPEEAQTMIDESISGKADSSAVTEEISAAVSGKADTSAMTTALADKADVSSLTVFFDSVEYNSTGKTIEFYNNGVLKDSIDATAFIKDGMVDSVTVEDITSGGTTVNCLVITFNTDSGKENINIPIKDIFDSDLYYTKTATDTLLDAKLNVSDFNTYSGGVNTAITAIEGDITNVQTALNGKANASDLTALETVVGGKLNTSDFNTYTSATETTINGKASQTDLETVSGNVDTISGDMANKVDTTAMTQALSDKLDISTFETFSGNINTALSGKASQSDLNTLSGDVANKLDISTFTAYSASVDTTLQGKADASDLANYVETSAYTAYTSATDTALSGKASQTDLNTVSGDVATVSGSVANKQDLLVSGTNIKTINNTSLLGSGNIEIQVSVDSALDSGSTNAVANSAITKTIQDNELVVANALITLQTALGGYSIVKMTSAEYEALVTKSPTTIYFIVD